MPVRKMPGGGYEAGTGGRHSQAQAGMYEWPPKKGKSIVNVMQTYFVSLHVNLSRIRRSAEDRKWWSCNKKWAFRWSEMALFLVNNLTQKVSNHQQQQRQQPRNGVQQLLQAQQASLDQYSNHKNNMLLLILGVGSSARHPAPSLLCRPSGCFRAGWPPWRGTTLSGIIFTFSKILKNLKS